ncbi:endonuclease, partial [Arthrobacter sp. CC3]
MGASFVALAACAGRVDGNAAGNVAPAGADPLQDEADACLDGMAEVGGLEAMLAALKVHFAAGYAHAAAALAAPAGSPRECTARDMAVTAEVACVLTVSERSAAALLADSATLTEGLPLTLAALGAGTISWQHARVMCDETS